MIKVPALFSPLKEPAKKTIRSAVQWRLNHLPISADNAETWSQTLRRWPAIFRDIQLQKDWVTLPNGLDMQLGHQDLIERTLRHTGQWDIVVATAIEQLLEPGDVFLDIGANIGYFSLLASRKVGADGLVIAFEPAQHTMAQLLSHLQANHCDNVAVCSLALANDTELAQLHISHAFNNGQTSLNAIGSAIRQQPTLLTQLDQILPANMAPKLIKLDIEGAEAIALEGMRALFARSRPLVICELIDPQAPNELAIQNFMAEQGYSAYRLNSSGAPLQAFSAQAGDSNLDVLFQPQTP